MVNPTDLGGAGFELGVRTRVVCGPGLVARAGELLRALPARRVFLVTDPGLVAAGHVARCVEILRAAGLEVRVFDGVRENPTESCVAACHAALGDWPPCVLVGFGGGSSIDVAKGCAFLHAGGGRMADYRGPGTARGTLLPVVAVPTTAGTGTEVQSFALISADGTHEKMACGDPQAAPRLALLDAELSVTAPAWVTACTGLDALGHAVETAVTRARTPVSALWSHAAYPLLRRAFPRVLQAPDDVAARQDMLLGAAYAGLAIEHSMLGAAHALANPLTARYGVTHGEAIGRVLPVVVRWNAEDPATAHLYADLARRGGMAAAGDGDAAAVAALTGELEQLLAIAGLPKALAEHGLCAADVPGLAAEAAAQWTGTFNPRPLDEAALRGLYERCLA